MSIYYRALLVRFVIPYRILPEEEAGSDESIKDASISRSPTEGSTTSSSRKSSVSQSAQTAVSVRDGGGSKVAEKIEKHDKADKGDKGVSTAATAAAAAAAAALLAGTANADRWADKGEKQIISTTLKKSCNWLREGMNVFVQKELGILRYIGEFNYYLRLHLYFIRISNFFF